MTREQELQWVQQARDGDQHALKMLINEVMDSTAIRTFANAIGPSLHMNDADDIILLARETTWRMVSNPEMFNPVKGRLAAIVWITVRNLASNMVRAEKRRGGAARVELNDEALELYAPVYRRDDDGLDVEITPDIDRVRSTLPEATKLCMRMLMEGYTLKEIADLEAITDYLNTATVQRKKAWTVGRIRTLISGPIRNAIEPIKEALRVE